MSSDGNIPAQGSEREPETSIVSVFPGIHVRLDSSRKMYAAEAFSDPTSTSDVPDEVHFTGSANVAWLFLVTALKNGGEGHVVVYDMFYPSRPRKLYCLGKMEGPTNGVVPESFPNEYHPYPKEGDE